MNTIKKLLISIFTIMLSYTSIQAKYSIKNSISPSNTTNIGFMNNTANIDSIIKASFDINTRVKYKSVDCLTEYGLDIPKFILDKSTQPCFPPIVHTLIKTEASHTKESWFNEGYSIHSYILRIGNQHITDNIYPMVEVIFDDNVTAILSDCDYRMELTYNIGNADIFTIGEIKSGTAKSCTIITKSNHRMFPTLQIFVTYAYGTSTYIDYDIWGAVFPVKSNYSYKISHKVFNEAVNHIK
ncbi:hypothetical protein [Francisella philomiragia]|uniref:hypothetical protein n=1 Tax=Francisella philomiragia TaxID=28110 RepID=UPI001B8BFDE5|nr:hypothetical protein [Francisella philomiragia]QUE31247.1 hypothetical protein IMS64_08520 [Francisella philomiragia]